MDTSKYDSVLMDRIAILELANTRLKAEAKLTGISQVDKGILAITTVAFLGVVLCILALGLIIWVNT